MKKANLMTGDFVEFGAGKAGLSSYIALEAGKESTFIVVEREARRNKKDKDIRALGMEVRREMMDIKDFDLSYFSEKKQIIGIAKHLCGGATDLTLASFNSVKGCLKGLAIATCCHHVCDALTYVNMKFINEELQIREAEF